MKSISILFIACIAITQTAFAREMSSLEFDSVSVGTHEVRYYESFGRGQYSKRYTFNKQACIVEYYRSKKISTFSPETLYEVHMCNGKVTGKKEVEKNK